MCAEAVDERVCKLLEPAVKEFATDKIDAAELERRKAAARATATTTTSHLNEGRKRGDLEHRHGVAAPSPLINKYC